MGVMPTMQREESGYDCFTRHVSSAVLLDITCLRGYHEGLALVGVVLLVQ